MKATRSRPSRCVALPALCLVGLVTTAGVCPGQSFPARPSTEVPLIEVVATEVRTFERPILPPAAGDDAGYREALVLEVEVSKRAMDELPPSMQPFLYIGTREVRIFQVTQGPRPERLRLVFHVPDWQDLPDGAPMVLTIDHGAPQRHPERYRERQDLRRFDKQTIGRRPPVGGADSGLGPARSGS